jgi:hypothetical protein
MSSHQEGIQTDEVDDTQLSAQAQAAAEARERLREVQAARAEQARLLNESRARARAEAAEQARVQAQELADAQTEVTAQADALAAAQLRLRELEQARLRNTTQGLGITAGTGNGGQGPRGELGVGDQRTGDPNAQGGLNRGQDNSTVPCFWLRPEGTIEPPTWLRLW